MAMFAKPQEYIAKPQVIRLLDFHERREMFVTRPPYQRKVVWKRSAQMALMDSIFRGYYIPRLVLRQVYVDDGIKYEVIDGQQRIAVVQRFFSDQLQLPASLRSVREDLPYKTYSRLPEDIKAFIDYEQYDVDMIYKIEDPYDVNNQAIVTEIFRRLQEGESLTVMEKDHARLNSLVRNFLVKFSDDITFDYENYRPVDENEFKHRFFAVVYRGKNDRMQHLAFLCRLLMFEVANGPADVTNSRLSRFIANEEVVDGIGNFTYEETDFARNVVENMDFMVEIFEMESIGEAFYDPAERYGHYLTLSIYLLLRHLNNTYQIDDEQKSAIRSFLLDFYSKWVNNDRSVYVFDRNSQNNRAAIQSRDVILSRMFFDFVENAGVDFEEKSTPKLGE